MVQFLQSCKGCVNNTNLQNNSLKNQWHTLIYRYPNYATNGQLGKLSDK